MPAWLDWLRELAEPAAAPETGAGTGDEIGTEAERLRRRVAELEARLQAAGLAD